MHFTGRVALPRLLPISPHQLSLYLFWGVSCSPFSRGESLAPLCPGIVEGR